MTMGVPKQYKAHIVTTQEARELLAKDDGLNRLVIVKVPHRLTELKEEIRGCETIYLGNMRSAHIEKYRKQPYRRTEHDE